MSKSHAENFIVHKENQESILPSLNFHNYVSKNDCLPFDNPDPFIEDLLEYSDQAPLQILVIAKPKVGKSSFCATLAKKLDIIHIDLELCLQKIFKKIKDFEENPELDEENNPKEFLSPLEREVINDLKMGNEVSNDSLLELMNLELDDPLVSLKGFLLDIPLTDFQDFSWISQIFNGTMRLPQVLCRYFSHVINLEVPDEEVRNVADNLRENLEDFKLYSEYDRILLKNPKPKSEEEEEAEENEEKKPLLDENLLIRPGDCPEFLEPLLEKYNQKTVKKIQALTAHLTKSQHISIQASGLPAEQLSEIALGHLQLYRDPLRPLPLRLDPGSDGNLKELLSQGLDEGRPARKWSGFYQIDPVELYQGKLIVGKAEFPVAFAGRVFLFEKEENLSEFMKSPCKYLKTPPKMPKGYNISLCGPHLSGKKTYAELLSKLYGWKIVDIEKIVSESLLDQKSWPAHIASNPTNSKIHCSEPEWKDIVKGNMLPLRNALPIALHALGFHLQKRPPKPPPKEGEEGYEEYKAAEDLAKENGSKEEEKGSKEKPGSKKGPRTNKAKKEEKTEEKEEEKEPTIEDLPLNNLALLPDEYGQFQPISGFIFINFPVNEEQVQVMKEFNFSIDKLVFLVDTNEEETEPGKILSTRPNFEALHSIENEMAFSDAALKSLQEQLTEEIVKTVSIVGPIKEVFNRIRTIIDPFYVRVDDETSVRVPADLVDGDEPLVYSDFGPYCPVTLLDEKWLVPGKEDQEIQVKGKRYRFYSEKEMKVFKNYVENYVGNTNKAILPPPPRIMFFGVRGSGLKTQLKLLNEKYKISVYELKEELIAQLNENKASRKRFRTLSRSFKPKEVNEEGQEVEDQELNEESADFDRKQHEISVLSSLISPLNEIFINGNFFDVEEEQVSTPILELLQEAKRLPEAAFFLKVSDKNMLPRVFDETKIRAEYNRLLEELRRKREEEKKAARQQAIENGEEPGEEEPEGPIEEDPEAPKLEEMLQEQRDKFLQRREADMGKIDELVEGFTNAGIPIVVLDCDRDIQSVFKAIVWELKAFLESRENKLEKHQVIIIPEEKVHHYKASYHVKKSRFHDFNALDLSHLPINHENCFMYRERLYFFEDEEKKKLSAAEPMKFLKSLEIPVDLNYRPTIFLVGKPKCGVSSLAKVIEKNLGVVRVKISKILEDLKENYSKLSYEALQLLKLGSSPNEEMCVELISQRVQQRDCLERGWVLDSFPQTVSQARLLAKKGIIPNCVLSVQLENLEIKKRVKERNRYLKLEFESMKVEFLKKKQEEAEENENEESKKNKSSVSEYEFEYQKLKLGYDGFLLHQRLRKSAVDITNLENFYLVHYNNVKFLNGNLSKWGLYERAKLYIQKTIKQRQMLARALVLREPCLVGDLAIGQKVILEFLSDFRNYCPVSFKSRVNYFFLKTIYNYSISKNLSLYL